MKKLPILFTDFFALKPFFTVGNFDFVVVWGPLTEKWVYDNKVNLKYQFFIIIIVRYFMFLDTVEPSNDLSKMDLLHNIIN